jgi:NAD(P)-dependent dehydrogenase (short-subunit alcohol dehydrogenase family)
MPDRIIVITGATDGLGRALSGALARRPATTLILHGRNQSRLDELATTLAGAPASIHTIRADFSEMAQVHRLADEITQFTDHISVLVNNAGIGGGEPDGTDRRLTVDGHELRFAVNHLAPFALTQGLLPLLDRGAPARIVNVASIGQDPINFDDPTLEQGYSGMRAYGQSKLAMITTGFTLARQLDPHRPGIGRLQHRLPRNRPAGHPAPHPRPRTRRGDRAVPRPHPYREGAHRCLRSEHPAEALGPQYQTHQALRMTLEDPTAVPDTPPAPSTS